MEGGADENKIVLGGMPRADILKGFHFRFMISGGLPADRSRDFFRVAALAEIGDQYLHNTISFFWELGGFFTRL